MVNEACEGKERPWYGLLAMLICKPIDIHRQREKDEPSKDLLHVRQPSTPSALPALTTARRSHDRPHNTSPSTEAPLPLMSYKNSSAVDRVICLEHTD